MGNAHVELASRHDRGLLEIRSGDLGYSFRRP
jgi:hypothetical protein